MSRAVALVCTLGVGALIALQPPANAALARKVSDIGAAFISLSISLAIVALLLVFAGQPGRLSGLAHFRPEYALGGIGGAAVVAVSLAAVRPLGAGSVIALLVASQLIVSVVADRLRWFGLEAHAVSASRIIGLVLVIGGTVLITRG